MSAANRSPHAPVKQRMLRERDNSQKQGDIIKLLGFLPVDKAEAAHAVHCRTESVECLMDLRLSVVIRSGWLP
ncbi:hypothetical protein [Bradyrhizobium sp. ORS 86]|uniref:hypothetical protein n=1 Tax=Bradyrhizobium sp. ORS 86 TaxID=1685970 RepID=UPI00388E76A8